MFQKTGRRPPLNDKFSISKLLSVIEARFAGTTGCGMFYVAVKKTKFTLNPKMSQRRKWGRRNFRFTVFEQTFRYINVFTKYLVLV